MVVYSADAAPEKHLPLRPPAPPWLPIPSLAVSLNQADYTHPSAPRFNMYPVADSPIVVADTEDSVSATLSYGKHLPFVPRPLRLNHQLDIKNLPIYMTTYLPLVRSPPARFRSIARFLVSLVNHPVTEEI